MFVYSLLAQYTTTRTYHVYTTRHVYFFVLYQRHLRVAVATMVDKYPLLPNFFFLVKHMQVGTAVAVPHKLGMQCDGG